MVFALLAVLALNLLAAGGPGPGITALTQAALASLFCGRMLAGARRGRLKLAGSPLHFSALFLLLLGLWQLGPLPPVSTHRYATQLALLDLVAAWLFFFLALHALRTRRQVFACLLTVLALAAALSAWGIAELAAGARSVSGPFVNRNHYAQWLTMAVIASFALFFMAGGPAGGAPGRRGWRRLFDFFDSPRPVLFVFTVFAAFGLFFSLSRGGMVSFLAGFLVLAVLLLAHPRNRAKSLVVPPLLFCLALLLGWFGAERIMARLASLASPAVSGDQRLIAWRLALTMFRDYPLGGAGLGTFASMYPVYRGADLGVRTFFSHAHNEYLQLLAEAGAAGFLAALGGGAVFFARAVRGLNRRRSPTAIALAAAGLAALAAGLGHAAVDFPFRLPANALLFALAAALATLGAGARFGPGNCLLPKRRVVRVRRPGFFAAGVALLWLLLLALAFQRPLAEHLAGAGKPEAAARVAPLDGRWPYQAARGYLEADDYRSQYALARPHLLEAVRREPYNSRYRQTLGWFYANMGEREAAEAQLRRAVELAPSWPVRRRAYRYWFPERPLPEPGV